MYADDSQCPPERHDANGSDTDDFDNTEAPDQTEAPGSADSPSGASGQVGMPDNVPDPSFPEELDDHDIPQPSYQVPHYSEEIPPLCDVTQPDIDPRPPRQAGPKYDEACAYHDAGLIEDGKVLVDPIHLPGADENKTRTDRPAPGGDGASEGGEAMNPHVDGVGEDGVDEPAGSTQHGPNSNKYLNSGSEDELEVLSDRVREQPGRKRANRQQTINDPAEIANDGDTPNFEDDVRTSGNRQRAPINKGSAETPDEDAVESTPDEPGRGARESSCAAVESDSPTDTTGIDFTAADKRSATSGETSTSDRPQYEDFDIPQQQADVLLLETRDDTPSVPYVAVPKVLREKAIQWKPILGKHRGLLAFLQLTLFSQQAGKRGGTVADRFTVRDAFGVESWRDTPASALIAMYRIKIDPRLKVLPPIRKKNLAREIVAHGIPAELVEMADEFIHHPEQFDELVYLVNGMVANGATRRAIVETRINEAEGHDPAIEPPEAARKIQRYLHERSTLLFKSATERISDAMDFVNTHPDKFVGRDRAAVEQKQQAAKSKLAQMRYFPKPIYALTDFSPRLRSHGENQLLTLKSAVRPVLYNAERDVELDLSKAHMAIVAKLAHDHGFDASVIVDYLKKQRAGTIDIWSELGRCTELEDQEAARKAVKRIYVGIYGGGWNEVLRQMSNEYADRTSEPHPGFDPFRQVLRHPLGRAVMRVQRRLKGTIRKKKGLEGAYDRWYQLKDFQQRDNPMASLLSYVVNTYELALIEPAFDAAIDEDGWASEKSHRRPRFQIWLLQYDGFTMRVSRSGDVNRWVSHLQDVVAMRARELGIITSLERAY